jgi:prepilin-type N-terminal cleavage/methylation domain-containing protein
MKEKVKINKRGFTLVEVSIVIAVLGILAAVLIPRLSNLHEGTGDKTALANAKSALTAYKAQFIEQTAPSIVIFVKGDSGYYIFGYDFKEGVLRVNPQRFSQFDEYTTVQEAVLAMLGSELNGSVFMLDTTDTIPPEYINITAKMSRELEYAVIYQGKLLIGEYAEPKVTPSNGMTTEYITTFRYLVEGADGYDTLEVVLSSYDDSSTHFVPADPPPLGDKSFAYWQLSEVNGMPRNDPAYELYGGEKYHLPNAMVTYTAVFLDDVPVQDPITNEYLIHNKQQLFWFRDSINNQSIPKDSNAKLIRDVILNSNLLKSDGTLNTGEFTMWTPISDTKELAYSGIFNGNGHSIRGLYIDKPLNLREGLFGYVDGATIKDLGIVDSYIRGKMYVGAIAGSTLTDGATTKFLRCFNAGVVVTASTVEEDLAPANGYAGGIIGFINTSATLNDCKNTGWVLSEGDARYIGGIVGYISKTSQNIAIRRCENSGTVGGCLSEYAYTGGIIGALYSSAEVKDCVNSGRVYADSNDVGGIIGIATQGVDTTAILNMENCGSTDESRVSGIQTVGGVIGSISNLETIITGAYNAGQVTGTGTHVISGVGGIIGISDSPVNIDSSYNTGAITNAANYTGGIIGSATNDTTITNSYNTGAIQGLASIGGIIGDMNSTSALVISECSNSGAIGTDTPILDNIAFGGIVGYCNAPLSIEKSTNSGNIMGYQSVGGIVGRTDVSASSITLCKNTGYINASDNYAGGIAGYLRFDSTITSCANEGNVTAGWFYAGGIIGFTYTETIVITVDSCYNLGLIKSMSYSGGIIAYACNGTITVTDCYNIGFNYVSQIIGKGGGILAHVQGDGLTTSVTNCYYIENSTNATETVNPSFAGSQKSEEAFSDDTVLNLLNGENPEPKYSSMHFVEFSLIRTLDEFAEPLTYLYLHNLPLILELYPEAIGE